MQNMIQDITSSRIFLSNKVLALSDSLTLFQGLLLKLA